MKKLRFLRFMERLFSYPAAYFGDLADSIDTDLHEKLRIAMKDINERKISQPGAEDGQALTCGCQEFYKVFGVHRPGCRNNP